MTRVMALLLLASLLAGCMSSSPSDEAACCATPVPGSVTVHTDGEFENGVTIWHRQ
jgi:hypothetical protein